MSEIRQVCQTIGRARSAACLLWLVSLMVMAPAHSATVTFTGNIVAVLEDTGAGTYAGATTETIQELNSIDSSSLIRFTTGRT